MIVLAVAVLTSLAFIAHIAATGIGVPNPDATPDEAAFERYHLAISQPMFFAAGAAWLAFGILGVAVLRFTIRDVLWLTVVVGMGVGWLIAARRQSEIEERYKSVKATLDSITEAMAQSKMDEQFRNAYDGPGRSAKQPR